MNRAELFDKAKRESEALSKEFPELPTIRSIMHQIDYLTQLTKGTTNDRSRLKEIVIGIQAAREIEPLNLELAELLYEVDAEARKM
jgi:hypothetical protein